MWCTPQQLHKSYVAADVRAPLCMYELHITLVYFCARGNLLRHPRCDIVDGAHCRQPVACATCACKMECACVRGRHDGQYYIPYSVVAQCCANLCLHLWRACHVWRCVFWTMKPDWSKCAVVTACSENRIGCCRRHQAGGTAPCTGGTSL
jgi:hypothetical protein